MEFVQANEDTATPAIGGFQSGRTEHGEQPESTDTTGSSNRPNLDQKFGVPRITKVNAIAHSRFAKATRDNSTAARIFIELFQNAKILGISNIDTPD
ncbi:hypothetical protein PUN28_018290 [Cardiocondyla obscurior]|uniref:Uncharacterized protein n=1 Tax=Cardiocondyla obscurior TaxID=286306 RepID=A0AAW2EGP6_9HYME